MNLMGISSFLAFSQYLGQFLAFEGEKRSKNGPKKTHLREATPFYTDSTGASSKWKSKWSGCVEETKWLWKNGFWEITGNVVGYSCVIENSAIYIPYKKRLLNFFLGI